jgi:hypothetical protein
MSNKSLVKTLPHLDSLRGIKAQLALPRYRLRGKQMGIAQPYVFAARCPRLKSWLVIHQDWWGFIDYRKFGKDYIASNDEAKAVSAKAAVAKKQPN